jgi:AmmeMemoRadiSam system protein B
MQVNASLAKELMEKCPLLKEDLIAHEREHSLEVQLPFLQVLQPEAQFVPIALGAIQWADLEAVGNAIGGIVVAAKEEVLLLTTSDLNHYEDEATTQKKDTLAITQLAAMKPRGLFDVCRAESISMCGLGPAVAMLFALKKMGTTRAEVVMHATSATVSGDYRRVVGYAGLIFD